MCIISGHTVNQPPDLCRRYLVDRGVVAATSPETRVVIQCPCGPVTTHVQHEAGGTADVRFCSVPSYAYALGNRGLLPIYYFFQLIS